MAVSQESLFDYQTRLNKPKEEIIPPSHTAITDLIRKTVNPSYVQTAINNIRIIKEKSYNRDYRSPLAPFQLPKKIYGDRRICDTVLGQSFLFAPVSDTEYLSFHSKLVPPHKFFLDYLSKTSEINLMLFNPNSENLKVFENKDTFILQQQTTEEGLSQETILFNPYEKFVLHTKLPRIENLPEISCISEDMLQEIKKEATTENQLRELEWWQN